MDKEAAESVRRPATGTMKAVRFHEFGGPEVLNYEDAPKSMPIDSVFKLKQARRAQEYILSRRSFGKIVLTP